MDHIQSKLFAEDIDNSNFEVKPNEEEMTEIQFDPVVPESVKSTIVLCVIAHGKDLCNEPLPDYNGKSENNTMIFTLADKNRIALNQSPTSETHTDYSYKMIRSLYENFNRRPKQPIANILQKLEKHINENGNHRAVSEKLVKQIESVRTYIKKEEELSDLKKHLVSCEKNRVGKPRQLKIDRLYDISDFDNFAGIHIIDIRNPKTKEQNNHTEIANDLNRTDVASVEPKLVKLSDILSVCYGKKYDFDYVTIIDFACRTSDEQETCINGQCCLKTCKNCRESNAEINRGNRLVKHFKELMLGGKSKSKQKLKIYSRRIRKK
jgi:hypothetical protein